MTAAGAIKLLVFDLDDTLLLPDKTVSDYTLSVLARCREAGILTAVATARSEKAASRVLGLVKPDIVISNGGALAKQSAALAKSSGETLYRRVISPETADRIIQSLKTSDGIGEITFDTDGFYLVSYHGANHPDYAHSVYYDFTVLPGMEAYKITAEIFDLEVRRILAAKFPDCNFFCFLGGSWCRFAHIEADKGAALKAVIEKLGISKESVAAFGDDLIDIGMFRESGIGVAMANAVDKLKEAADFICGPNEKDGAVEWIERHILAARGNMRGNGGRKNGG